MQVAVMVSSLSLNVDQNQLPHVIIMASVIRMNHVTVLIVMIKWTIVRSTERVNNLSVPKIRLLRVLLINSHIVSQLVSMVIPVMRVDSVWQLLRSLPNHSHVLFVLVMALN